MKTQYKSHNFPEHFCPLQTIFLALNLSERFVGHQIWTCCSLYENGVQVLSFTILSSVTFVKNNNLFTCRVKNCQFETLFILCTKIYWNPTFCIQEHFQILYFIIVCSILMKRCKNSYLPINMLLENWWFWDFETTSWDVNKLSILWPWPCRKNHFRYTNIFLFIFSI